MEIIQPYSNYLIALLVVIGLILVLALILRQFGGGARNRRGNRLSISETREIDKNRSLILLRRDDVEHLILIGGQHDLVIETNIDDDVEQTHPPIRRAAPAYQEQPFDDYTAAPPRPAPRPVEKRTEPNLTPHPSTSQRPANKLSPPPRLDRSD